MRIRPLLVEDVPAAVVLMREVAAEGRWLGTEVPFDEEERAARFLATVERDDVASFVADAGDEGLVGMLGIELTSYGVAELGMQVAAAWRGRGVGSGLMEAALEWVRGTGAHKVALEVWPHNEAARALYRKFGFEEEGVKRRHYRRRNGELWDAVVMGLLLPGASG